MQVRTFAALALLSCGGGGDAGDAGEAGSDVHADVIKDAAMIVDASDDANAGASPNDGVVTLLEYKQGTTAVFNATASFETVITSVPPPACTQQVGSRCYWLPTDGGASGQSTSIAAGTITLKYVKTIGTLTPNGTTYPQLSSVTTPSLQWLAGDLVDVSASGDSVHAFGGNVTTATLFANVSPPLDQSASVSRAQNFTLSWTAATGAIDLEATSANAGYVTCHTPSDSGSITIDASLLTGFANGPGSIVITRTTTADVSPDNARVALQSETQTSGLVQYTN